MAITIGQQLDSYEITALLGKGGMGEVCRATDTKLNRDGAIKFPPAQFASDPDRIERFQREAYVLASLNHSSIAAIYGLEEADRMRALVMELVEARRSPSVSPKVRCRLTRCWMSRRKLQKHWSTRTNTARPSGPEA
jgi:hypothetical protein